MWADGTRIGPSNTWTCVECELVAVIRVWPEDWWDIALICLVHVAFYVLQHDCISASRASLLDSASFQLGFRQPPSQSNERSIYPSNGRRSLYSISAANQERSYPHPDKRHIAPRDISIFTSGNVKSSTTGEGKSVVPLMMFVTHCGPCCSD
jgi:hypothetical protein